MVWSCLQLQIALHCNCNIQRTILDVFRCLFFSFWVYTVMFCWTLLLIGTFFKEPLRSCVLDCTMSNILDGYSRPVLSSLTREQATSLQKEFEEVGDQYFMQTHKTTFEKYATGRFLLPFHVKICQLFSKLSGGICSCSKAALWGSVKVYLGARLKFHTI